MKNLTELVKEYKQTKEQKLLDLIFEELRYTIKKKSKNIFFNKWYPYSLYHKCKSCRECKKDENISLEEQKIICENCEKCSCIKGSFNLKKSGLCDYNDIKNDLVLEILRIIKNYNPEKDFNTYLFASLWEWYPSFLNKNFIKSLQNKTLTTVNSEGEENEFEVEEEPAQTALEEKEETAITIEQIYNVCKNDTERKTLELLEKGLNQRQIAKELKVSYQYISLIIKELRKKLKKFREIT